MFESDGAVRGKITVRSQYFIFFSQLCAIFFNGENLSYAKEIFSKN